ncbi:MAG: hypothetical protein HUJ22_05995 [Gracilimonas sp.]|uniref:hypothetical protein n=1 Tax=Gracilimonas sp. TaxID=1974203 RepID=UPI0019AB60B5|nr:hypothetical protein [Gracilimonas sp.]MBD3616108.1 hypothetical protein [Gracilimonas sp.]
MKHITNHYSEAQPLSSLEKRILKELDEQSIKPRDCIWGTSICSDEVNNSLLGLSKHFKAPGPFFFGGISGIPFTGKTGFKAFSSHIPDDGGAVILYGPHIGLNKEGVIGKVHREGQENPTSCCGSLIAGLNNVKEGNVLTISHDDYQQGQVNKILIEHFEQIKKSDTPIKTTTEIAFNQIKRELTDIVSSCLEHLGSSPILLIGGIVINTDWNQEDFFEIRDLTWFNH